MSKEIFISTVKNIRKNRLASHAANPSLWRIKEN